MSSKSTNERIFINKEFPYAVPHSRHDQDISAIEKLGLKHVTDYLYWRQSMRFRDESNATMYKLMQNIS